MVNQADLEQILKKYRVVAVVGLSGNPEKSSNQVAQYLQEHGYHIIPVNPTSSKILGQKAYKSLLDLPPEEAKTIEIVEIFRPPEDVPLVVDQAIKLKTQYGKPCVIWMQRGIINRKAAEKAQKAGLTVVMDRCMMTEHSRMLGEKEDAELERIRTKKMKDMMKEGNAERITTPITVTDNDFNEVIKRHALMVVDCWAAWCGPCRQVAPIIDELAEEHAGEIAFAKLNVDENPETATRFSIMSIPTLLIMKDGKEVDRLVGAAPKLLIENRLKKHI